MRISPVNFNTNATKQNFNGILVETGSNSYDSGSYETTVYEYNHDYYPFKDETEEEIKKAIAPFQRVEEDNMPYPAWNTRYEYSTTVKPPLDLTMAQYTALKKAGLKDDLIIDIYQ